MAIKYVLSSMKYQCPNCKFHQEIKAFSSNSVIGPQKYYLATPFIKCERCGLVFTDKRLYEWACMSEEERIGYFNMYSSYGLLGVILPFLTIGLIPFIAGITNVSRSNIFLFPLLLGISMLLVSVIVLFVMLSKNKRKNKKIYDSYIVNSINRCSDLEYLKQLQEIGYPLYPLNELECANNENASNVNNLINSLLTENTKGKTKEIINLKSNIINNLTEFYTNCIKEFHDVAMNHNMAKRGLIYIPELIEYGDKAILKYLQDPNLQEACGNPMNYYLTIMVMVLKTGLIFAAVWHENYGELKNGFAEQVIAAGPTQFIGEIVEKDLKMKNDDFIDFCQNVLFIKWLDIHEPYWKLKDPKLYTLSLFNAIYQLGISMELSVLGY